MTSGVSGATTGSGSASVTSTGGLLACGAEAAGGAALAAGLFSDERLKTDIGDGDKAAKKALETLAAKTYRYKDPKYGAGPQLGVMAQALEKAGLKQAVIDTPEGKAIDHAKLTGANTSMLAALAKRVGKLEKGGR